MSSSSEAKTGMYIEVSSPYSPRKNDTSLIIDYMQVERKKAAIDTAARFVKPILRILPNSLFW